MPSFFKQKGKTQSSDKKSSQKNDKQKAEENKHPEFLSADLWENLEELKRRLGGSSDIVQRTLKIGREPERQAAILSMQGLTDNKSVVDAVIDSIMNDDDLKKPMTPQETLDTITDRAVPLGTIKTEIKWTDVLFSLLSGNTLIFINGTSQTLIANTQGGEKRAIMEPSTNVTVRGPRNGFVESIETNIAMVRRIINNPDLWVETMKIGKITKTDVSIMYLNGIANHKIVQEVRDRLKKIDIDSILESGYIEQLIEDQSLTPFPTIINTERPDMVAGNLLEGRIAIFVNGTPFVLLVPALFFQFFQSIEDYYQRFDIASMIRFLRILIYSISIVGPAIYVAATTFHQEMIPTELLIIIAAQRETVPFPAVVEALGMELTFEILREAGLRMPKVIGATMSIVGALVIGQAAVQAGIVSPAMVIIVSITAIASFATPSYSIAISARIIRFAFILSAGIFGFFGLILAFIILVVHLSSIRSFGIPYMSPLAPLNVKGVGDSLVRKPLWMFNQRPRFISENNQKREGNDQKPSPPTSDGIKVKDKIKGDTP